MAHVASANDSRLTIVKDGYDFVVATTQASINSGLKEFLAEDGQPDNYLCFIVNENGNPDTIVSLEKLIADTGVDPFKIPDRTDTGDVRVKKLTAYKFNVGIRLKVGLPSGIVPKDLPKIIELGSVANNVKFRLLCSEFDIIVNTPPSPWGGGGSWDVLKQPPSAPWYFETTVDLIKGNLDAKLDTPYFNKHPEERDALKRALDNISGTAFSLQQLLLDLDSTVLQNPPDIIGVERGSNADLVLTRFFTSFYARMAKEYGWPLLNVTVVSQSPDPSQLRLTEFERQVNLNKSSADATTLDNVCVCNNHRMPALYNFSWNWVEYDQVGKMSGVMSINRNTLAKFFMDQLEPVIKQACLSWTVGVTAYWDLSVKYSYGFRSGNTPTRTINDTGSTVCQLKYTSSAWDEDKSGLTYGAFGLDYNYTCDIKFSGSTITVVQNLLTVIDMQFLNERTSGFKAQARTITDPYTLMVDQAGNLRLTKGATNDQDRSDSPGNGGIGEWFTNFNDFVQKIKDKLSGAASARLTDAPLNGVSDFVYPGSKVFTYKESRFSSHQDLLADLTYVSPTGSKGRSSLSNELGLRITSSSELMQNYAQGELVTPTGKFEALQTDSLNGHSLLFAIDSNSIFNVIKEDSGKTCAGWEIIDLSSEILQLHPAEDKKAGAVRTFGVGQSALDGTISLAMAADLNGGDSLFLSLGNSSSDTAWLNYVGWTLVPFDDSSVNSKSIRIADIMFAETYEKTRYTIVDVNTAPESGPSKIVRYHIDMNSSSSKWIKHDLPIDIESGDYQSVIGRRAGGYVDGVYTTGTAGGSPQLIYQPIVNVFGEGPPTPVRFNLPGGVIPQAIATVRNTDESNSRLVGTTDLYTIGGSKLYRFPADKQKDNATGEEVLDNPIFQGSDTLRAMMRDGVVTIWAKNASNEVFYVACLSEQVQDPGSWSAAVPVVTGVERMSTYLNRVDGGNTVFTAGGGKLSRLIQATDTKTKAWRPQEIRLASTPKQQLQTFKAYTTTIHLRDNEDQAVPDAKLKVWADSHTPAYINGLYYVLGTKSIDIPTDAAGNITIIEATEDLHASILSVSIPRDTETTVINPMDTVFEKLSALDTRQKLKDAKYPAKTVAGGVLGPVNQEPLVDPSTGDGDLNQIANNMDRLKEAWNHSRPPSRTRRLFFSDRGPKVVPAKGFNNSAERIGTEGLEDIWMAAGDLFRWLKSGIEAFIEIVKDAATGALHFIAKVAGQVYRAVLDAADSILGALEWVFNAIKTVIEDVIRFIEFLFQWDDIKRTKQVLHKIINLYLKHQVSQIDTARAAISEHIEELEDTVAKWAGTTDWSSLGDSARRPAAGSAKNPAEGHNSASLLLANHFRDQTAKMEVQSTVPKLRAETEDMIKILLDAISEEGEVLSGVYQELQVLASRFKDFSVGDIIKAIAGILAKGLLSSAKVVIDALFRVLSSLASSALDLLDAKIHIPIISDILNAIGVPDITFLDLFAWIGAVGYTVVYKIANGQAPFPDNSIVKGIIAANSWNDLESIFDTGTALESDFEKTVIIADEKEPLFSALNEAQKMLHIAGHGVAGFTLFTTNFLSTFEAEAMTGENPFALASTVAGVVVAGTQGAAGALAPRDPIENSIVNAISNATTVAGVVNKVLFSGQVQKRLATSSTKFSGLAVNDGRATASIVDVILIFPALFVSGWHFYELSEKPAGKERSAAILMEVTRLTSYVSRVSYAVAVNDKDPASKQIPIIVMAVSNTVGAGLETATAIVVE